mgnify:CR=1 FL=1
MHNYPLGVLRVSDPDDSVRMAQLEAKIAAAKAEFVPKPHVEDHYSQAHTAWRMVIELVAGLSIGFGIGYGLDRLFGTLPLFLVIFIMLGLVAGIRAAPGAVWSALKSVVMGGVNRVKSFLGIKSPSRLFMGIGSNVTDGLALGVAGGQPRVDAQMASMARRMEVPIRPVLRPSFMARAGRVVRRVAAPMAMAAGAQVAMPAAATIAPPVSVADVAGAGPDSGMTEASPPRERLSEMRGLLRSVVLSPRYDIKIDLGSIKDLDEAAIRRLFEDLLREHDRELEALLRRALHD